MALSEPIAVKDLSKVYPARVASVVALERISFSVGEGEFIAVVGPTDHITNELIGEITGFGPAKIAGEAKAYK